ncbi:MAG: FkbM family methyltransferase [Usitatibacter sp.]
MRRIKALLRRVGEILKGDPDRFLREVSGVIHVGANAGQERDLYERHGLRVLWIEPIPEVFELLEANIAGLARQRALQCLVTDRDDVEYPFHVANNEGASSSILEFDLHRDIWPDIAYERTIVLRSKTLASVIAQSGVAAGEYDALIVDTQGSELLVLQGAGPVLHNFAYIKTRVPDFRAYAGGCEVADVAAFLAPLGYREHSRHDFARRPGGAGSYYDIIYKREA